MKESVMDIFMAPRSVAVLGVSRRTGKGSFNLVEALFAFGYQGEIYPVNPWAEEIAGLRAYPDVRAIPGEVDLAVISTPRETVPQLLEACAERGIRGAVVVPQGFADADHTGQKLQDQLAWIARNRGIRVLGPNTLGVMNAFSGFTSSFMPLPRQKAPVGVICQSGIFFVGAPVFTGLIGKGIDIGNGCDLDFADALNYFGRDEETQVVFVHMEGSSQGRRFFDAARAVARRKPVIAFKTARSPQGAEAARSHTGSLVGNYATFEAAMRQAGVVPARDAEEGLDSVKAFLYGRPMTGPRVALVTFTGAGAIMLIDTFEEMGLRLARLGPKTLDKVQQLSPPWMNIQNPLDIWPALMKHGMGYVYGVALEAVLKDPEVDGVVCIAICPRLPEDAFLDATAVIRDVAARFPHKPVAAWLYGPNQGEVSRNLEQGGHVMAFPTLPRATRALATLYRRYVQEREA